MCPAIVRPVLVAAAMVLLVTATPAGARAACPAAPASARIAGGEPLLVALTPLTPKW